MYDVINDIIVTRHWTGEKDDSAALSEPYWSDLLWLDLLATLSQDNVVSVVLKGLTFSG